MRFVSFAALLMLTACDGSIVDEDAGISPPDAGAGDCAASEADAECLCAPQVVPADTPFEVVAHSSCACVGAQPAGCEVVLDGSIRILLRTTADTCAVGNCSLPACEELTWTCDIPALAAGTYVVESCRDDLCTERWVTVGDADGGVAADAGVADCSDTILRADFSCR